MDGTLYFHTRELPAKWIYPKRIFNIPKTEFEAPKMILHLTNYSLKRKSIIQSWKGHFQLYISRNLSGNRNAKPHPTFTALFTSSIDKITPVDHSDTTSELVASSQVLRRLRQTTRGGYKILTIVRGERCALWLSYWLPWSFSFLFFRCSNKQSILLLSTGVKWKD